MAKLSITGGGRCNLTNTFEGVDSLASVYPRGDKFMRKVLGRFGWQDTCRWFEDRGVRLVAQEDHCIFPASQDAMQIVRTLQDCMKRGGVEVRCNCKVESIEAGGPGEGFLLKSVRKGQCLQKEALSRNAEQDLTVISAKEGNADVLLADAIVLTTGGGTAKILESTGIELVPDVPSLFTFKINDNGLRALMGTVVDNVALGLAGTRFRSQGTLLLTDWGVSGPATLRLSSYAARYLAENQYQGSLLVNWLCLEESAVRERLSAFTGSSRMIVNSHPAELTERLWRHIVERAGIRSDMRWSELGSKGLGRLVNVLISDTYEITGRARFKEEFVTCGGVSLSEVRPDTMESRKLPGLFFAGEVLDIDAVTGGFNLQSAWSTAHLAAHSLAAKLP